MAEDSEMWKHIGDLHRKHSELAIQMHDRHSEDSGEMLSAVQELTSVIRELITAVKQDVKADLAESRSDSTETSHDSTSRAPGRNRPISK